MLDFLLFILGFATLAGIFLDMLEIFQGLFANATKLKGWVCVTGGSDGIGLGLSKSLSKLGCNLVIISRNKSKLESAKKIIETYGAKVEIIQADLATADIRVYQDIVLRLKKFEISGLINCAGTSFSSFFHMLNVNDLLTMVNLNIWPVVMFSKEFKNSWIINVSSTASINPTPILTTYSATKAFIHCFSQVLSSERPNVLSYQCGFVDTELTKKMKFKPMLVKPRELAYYLFKSIGKRSWTLGHWKHWVLGIVLKTFPTYFTSLKPLQIMKKKFKYS